MVGRFQSTHPLRGATCSTRPRHRRVRFQSTHPLRGATGLPNILHIMDAISIHAPLAGCDMALIMPFIMPSTFQSTHPLRGATQGAIRQAPRSVHFNPRTPCGVRHDACNVHRDRYHFNPRTPCGVRRRRTRTGRFATNFNPRTPCGVRRTVCDEVESEELISIHAPLAGCDCAALARHRSYARFQSTHPLRGATLPLPTPAPWGCNFNPRTPCGVRQRLAHRAASHAAFQSTHPLRGATGRPCGCYSPQKYFNPRTPCGVRPRRAAAATIRHTFQSTHPLRGATARNGLF